MRRLAHVLALRPVVRFAAYILFVVLLCLTLFAVSRPFRAHAQIITHSAILPTQISVIQQGVATPAQNFNSGFLQFWGSLFDPIALQPTKDQWAFQVFENSCAATCGSDFEINHNSISNGAGRFHVNSDFIVGPPADATASQNDNSFAWDAEGSYWDGTQAQNDIWEQTVGTTPATGGNINARLNIYPVFPSPCASCTADVALGAFGTNPQQGNPAGPPMFDFIVLPRDGHIATFTHPPGGMAGDQKYWVANVTGPLGISWRQICTLSAGTCTVTFSQGPYFPAPICTANGETVANAMAVASTTTTVTIHSSSGTDTQVVNIVCGENGEN